MSVLPSTLAVAEYWILCNSTVGIMSFLCQKKVNKNLKKKKKLETTPRMQECWVKRNEHWVSLVNENIMVNLHNTEWRRKLKEFGVFKIFLADDCWGGSKYFYLLIYFLRLGLSPSHFLWICLLFHSFEWNKLFWWKTLYGIFTGYVEQETFHFLDFKDTETLYACARRSLSVHGEVVWDVHVEAKGVRFHGRFLIGKGNPGEGLHGLDISWFSELKSDKTQWYKSLPFTVGGWRVTFLSTFL